MARNANVDDIDYARSMLSYFPQLAAGINDFSKMTVGETLTLFHEATVALQSMDWNEVYSILVNSGYGNDPALAPGLEMIRKFMAGDFTEFYDAVDLVTSQISQYPSYTTLGEIFDFSGIPGGGNPVDPFPAHPEIDGSGFAMPSEAEIFVNEFFDEQSYLSANPDVRLAVEAGYITAREHFEQYGFGEGRSTRPKDNDFNESVYLENNPDVAAAVQSGLIASGRDHYEQYGVHENRLASTAAAGFQENHYLALNPDVKEAVNLGYIVDGRQHYDLYGANEGRSFSFSDSITDGFGRVLDEALYFGSSVAQYVEGEVIGQVKDMLYANLSLQGAIDINKYKQIETLYHDQANFINAAFDAINGSVNQMSPEPVDNFFNNYLPNYLDSLWDNVF